MSASSPQGRQPGRPAPLTPVTPAGASPWRSGKERLQAIWMAAGAVIAIITGAVMEAATSSTIAMCDGVVGQIGQAVNYGSSRTDCGIAGFFGTFGSVLLWTGGVVLFGTAVLYFARQENNRKIAAAAAAAKAGRAPRTPPAP